MPLFVFLFLPSIIRWAHYLFDLLLASNTRTSARFQVSIVVEDNLHKIFPKESREEVESLPRIDWNPNVDYTISDRPNFR